MARNISYFPTNENITKEGPFSICRIWNYGAVEIERVIGTVTVGKGWAHQATRIARYENASKASRARLHRVVENLVNKGQGKIGFIFGDLGLGYEVEI